jgi:hypothetical protein
MNVQTRPIQPKGLERAFPWVVLVPFLVGAALAVLGPYWDDAWHTNRGRDSFLIPPHVLIYSGVMIAGSALALWAALNIRQRGLRPALADRSLVLGMVGVLVTLAAAPIDNLWHTSFGRDAVLWSPPHVLGIAGVLGLAVAVLVQAERQLAGRWLPAARALVGGAGLAAATFVVVEYETDVPQFNVRYYLPVLCLATALAFSFIRTAARSRWPATGAAGVHFVLVGLAGLFLLAIGWDAPILPLLILPAALFDLGAERGWSRPIRAAAYVGLTYVLYVPWVNLVYGGVYLGAGAVVTGLPLALASTWLVLVAFDGGRRRLGGAYRSPLRRALVTGALALAAVAAFEGPAWAHDPGEGREVGATHLVATVSGRRAHLAGRIVRAAGCRRFHARDLAARRAHVVLRAPLRMHGCNFSGSMRLSSRGRWFLYADLAEGRRGLESWLPVKTDGREGRFEKRGRSLYLPARSPNTPVKTVATAFLYLGLIAFLLVIARLARQSSWELDSTASARPRH